MININLYIFDTRNKKIDEAELHRFLSNEDIFSLSKYKNEQTRLEKLISMYLKRKYIGEYYLSKDDKPLSNNIYFNISHSKGVIALATSKEYPIGLDIEVIRDYKDELAKYISNEDEYKYIVDNKSFFEIWTSKEALVKCFGSGLSTNVKDIPALPLNDIKQYKGKTYSNKSLIYNDVMINVTLEIDKVFKITKHIEATLF